MLEFERDRAWSRVVEPTRAPLRPFVDEERRDHEAFVGRWVMRLVPVACAGYIAWALLGGGR